MLIWLLWAFLLLVMTGMISEYFGNTAGGFFFWIVAPIVFFYIRSKKKKQKQSIKKEYSAFSMPLENKDVIEFTYTNADGITKHRKVRVVHVDDVYIEGYCHTANDTRTFRLDRIDGLIKQEGEYYPVEEWLERQGIYTVKYRPKLQIKKSKSNPLEICFTGFSKADKEHLEILAKVHDFKVRKTVTHNLNFLVTGYNAGPSKIDSAMNVGAILLNESQFRKMIETGEITKWQN